MAPGRRAYFRYSVETPEDSTHLWGLFCFSARPVGVEVGKNQAVVVPRIAIPVYLEITRAQPGRLEVQELAWRREPDQARLALRVRNVGERLIRPRGTVRLREERGGFDQRLELNSEAGPVFPGRERVWSLVFDKIPSEPLLARVACDRDSKRRFEDEQRLPPQ